MKINLRPFKPKSDRPAPPLSDCPTIRIIIGDEADDPASGKASAIWHPEDKLEGSLQVSSPVGLEFDEIFVRFNGRRKSKVPISR